MSSESKSASHSGSNGESSKSNSSTSSSPSSPSPSKKESPQKASDNDKIKVNEKISKSESGSKSEGAKKEKKMSAKPKEDDDKKKVEWSTDPTSLRNQKKIKLVIDTLEENYKDDDKHAVLVEYYFAGIDNINTVEQNVAIDLFVQWWWIERSLTGMKDGDFTMDDIKFKPDISLANTIEMNSLIDYGEDNHSVWQERVPEVGSYSDHGIITQFQHFKGTLRTPLFLQDFPFDAQQVKLTMGSEMYASAELQFIDITADEAMIQTGERIKMDEWDIIGGFKRECGDFVEPTEGRAYSNIIVTFTAQRKIGFYMQKVVFVLFLLGLFMAGSFFVPPETLNDRFQIALTLMLSTVAFNFVTSELLPKISYLTMIDKYFFGTYIFLAISVVEHIVVYKIYEAYGRRLAIYVDYGAIGFFVLIFLIWTALFLAQGFRARHRIAKRHR